MTRIATGIRALYVVFFAAVHALVVMLLIPVVFLQFVFVLITGRPSAGLQRIGHALAKIVYDILRFVVFVRERKPFPFDEFAAESSPSSPAGGPPDRRSGSRDSQRH